MTQTPRFCEHCGAALNPDARFCNLCGQAVEAAPAPAAATATPAAPAEPVLGVIAGLQRRKGLFGSDMWNLVVTPRRLIFALMTKEAMNDAVRQMKDQAKGEGKGFWGQMVAQMGWLQLMVDKYAAMPLEQTLSEQPDNFSFALNQVKKAKIEHRLNSKQHTSSNHIILETTSGKHEFQMMGGGLDEARRLLTSVLGGAVQ